MTEERRKFDEALDATRRTRLANERTYLAWWRTGLRALAVSLAAGKVVPGLVDETDTWPYQVIGADEDAVNPAIEPDLGVLPEAT